jgi:hypothetical protein
MAPLRPFPRRLLALTTMLLLSATPALAGSVTADSILDQEGARQAAMEQMPRGATVTGSRCQEIGVGGIDNPRYRCTVEYRPAGVATQPAR